MEISLEQLLESRDARGRVQRAMLEENPLSTLVCLTVVMPGSVKRNEDSLAVARAATLALEEAFPGCEIVRRDLPTGYEAYLLTPLSPLTTKSITCSIEETHPLGRLFDLDVMGRDGVPVDRSEVGLPPRRCLLCGKGARECMRARTHSIEELTGHIHEMVNAYV